MVGLLICLMLCAICWLFLLVFELNDKVKSLKTDVAYLQLIMETNTKSISGLINTAKDQLELSTALKDLVVYHLRAYHGYAGEKETEETNND